MYGGNVHTTVEIHIHILSIYLYIKCVYMRERHLERHWVNVCVYKIPRKVPM